jgi:hypothetical protein
VHLKYFPPYKLTPTIANIKKTTAITIATLKMALTDSRRATTISFKSLLCEMNLSGLKTLRSLRILMKGIFIDYKDISKSELETIPKSNMFQLSLK